MLLQDSRNARPAVQSRLSCTGFRLCQGCGSRDDILRASLGGELPGKAIMLQASGSFFAYEPILKALQSNHSMPLAHYIAAPSLPKRNPEAGSSLPERTPGASLLSKLGSKLFGANPGGIARCTRQRSANVTLSGSAPTEDFMVYLVL